MGKRLREIEYAEIRNGNFLIISCQGEHNCGGWVGIPFKPGIDGASDGKPLKENGAIWKRDSGDTLDNLSLSPSINAEKCGHFFVKNGEIV